jgi:uncharacterized protein (TIGR01777 family)
MVLGRGGGALATLAPAYRFGLGGPMGSGRQYMSWIHLADLLELCVRAISDARWAGAINAVAPEALPNREFARAVGKALGRPAFLPAPATALRLALGEAATALLASQRVVPVRLRELEFGYRFPTLESALADALGR